jgi:LPXTG-motif cell wall-anchored protein
MTLEGILAGAAVAALFGYLLRRRKDVMKYHDIDTPRIDRHREGGV